MCWWCSGCAMDMAGKSGQRRTPPATAPPHGLSCHTPTATTTERQQASSADTGGCAIAPVPAPLARPCSAHVALASSPRQRLSSAPPTHSRERETANRRGRWQMLHSWQRSGAPSHCTVPAVDDEAGGGAMAAFVLSSTDGDRASRYEYPVSRSERRLARRGSSCRAARGG
jgi:hypothetical protein